MRNLLGLSTLCIGAATLLAQAPATGSVVMIQQPAGQNCPVGLRASRLPDGGMAEVSPASKPHGQALHLTFAPFQAHSVVQADITLHGISGSHIVPAGERSSADATENFSVSPSSGPNHLFNTVVYLQKLTGVDWVELNEITFADGTKWHASATSTCRVAPNGFQLVASGK